MWYEVEISNSTGYVVGYTFLYSELTGTTTRQIGGCSDPGPTTKKSHNPVIPEGLDITGREVVIDTQTSKVNPRTETECFDLTMGGKLTIYVQQPKENSDTAMGENSVGHAFIGLEQNGSSAYLGFYPPKNVSRTGVALDRTYKAELRDNSEYMYHVSISRNITPAQMKNIVNYVNDFPENYKLSEFACVDFAIAVGKKGGLNLPSTTVTYFGQSGRSPGKFGQEIRAMNSDSNITVTKSRNNSPAKKKGC